MKMYSCHSSNNAMSFAAFVIILCCACSFVDTYNVDTAHPIKHQGPRHSMFGFTVASHFERGSSMVLVGAPKAQTNQPGVERGGAVYRCDISRNDTCYVIPFDRTGDFELNGKIIDQKSNQWFGSTLFSAGREGPVVACASRYVWFSSKYDRRDPVGTCYVARNYFNDFSEYSPCRTAQWGFHRQGTCQAGFSAAISKDGNNLFVGAPGNCYWQGRMYSVDATRKFPYRPPLFAPFGTGRLTSQSLYSRPGAFHTKDGSAADDDSYLGYSLTVGNFTGDKEDSIAAGMPRGGGLLGKILLYTWNLTNFMNITGRQMGSYFGYAVAAADVDGDGYDDLVIGAPLFTESNNEGKYEVGKVYVVYQRSKQGRFMRVDELDGINSKSRFGLSLTSLGDINLDGFIDFAVGAPYDGPRERGAVYIFHGSFEGVRKKYTQVIYAEEVSRIPPSTFGFSLAGGIDLDRNAYPDTVIGAYLSDQTYFLRSKPVVKVTGYAQFQTANKEIVLEDKNCRVKTKNGTVLPVACTTINTCLNYTGVGVPRDISLELQFTLDTQKKKDPRMFFLENETPLSNMWNRTWRLSKDSPSTCTERTVYIKDDIQDKLTPLDVEVLYSMDTRYYAYSDLPPVLDLTSNSLQKDSISVRKNCGSDNVCVPDLSLEVKPNVDRYLIASNAEELYFDITVSNKKEDSFETKFTIQLPEYVNYGGIENTGDVKVGCIENKVNRTFVCNIGNPLPAQKIVNFKMYFKPRSEEGMKRFYVFDMKVDSANPENDTTADNHVKIELPVWVNSRLELKGTSRPSEVRYNWSYYADMEKVNHEREIGPQVIHLYTITNNGPSAINEAEVLIFWPSATASGEDLMYLLDPPHVLGNVRCERADFNYQGYFVEKRNKTIWEAFDIDVSKEQTSYSKTSETTKSESGIYIEQNEKKFSASSEDRQSSTSTDFNNEKFEKATGDASEILREREKQRGRLEGTAGADGKTVLVTSSGGQEKIVTKTETFTNRSTGPGGGVYTYTKNTTLTLGPHGEVIRNQTTFHQGGRGGGGVLTRDSVAGQSAGGGGGSVRVGGEGIYEAPYSSVEYEVAEPNFDLNREEELRRREESRQQHGGQHQSQSSHLQGGRFESGHQQGGQSESNHQQGGRFESSHQQGGQYESSHQQGGRFESGHQQGGQSQSSHQQGGQYHQGTHQQGGQQQQSTHYQGGTSQYGQHYGTGQSGQHHSTDYHQEGGVQHQYDQNYHHGGQYEGGSQSYGAQSGGTFNRTYDSHHVQPVLNAATLGQGGKVGFYDLGVLNKNAEDEYLNKHGSAEFNGERSGRYDPDLGRIVYDTPRQRGGYKSRTFSEERAGNRASTEDDYNSNENTRQSHWSSSSSSHSYGGGSSNTEESRQNVDYNRKKRQVVLKDEFDLAREVHCKTTKCKFVRCYVGPMRTDEDATIALRTRLNVTTLRNISSSHNITFSSMMVGKITSVPFIGIPSEKETVKFEIPTKVVASEVDGKPDIVPLWVVVLSAIAGALILLLLIFLFYKCGFFKRNRPSNVPERQPLNRNGHYASGDEAL